jgi:hypothetical protein
MKGQFSNLQFPDIPYVPAELSNELAAFPSQQSPYYAPGTYATPQIPPPINTNLASQPTSTTSAPKVGDKRPSTAVSVSASPASPLGSGDALSRAAAEEDKRRRNTAASARFRVKKKQREQALEKSAKEMTDKVEALESRITQLETENRWLRGLVVDKTGKQVGEMPSDSKTEIKASS